MRFTCDGQTYSTNDLISLEVRGDAYVQGLYLTPDRCRVFVLRFGWDGVMVHRAGRIELEMLVGRFAFPELRAALAALRGEAAPPEAAPPEETRPGARRERDRARVG